MLGTEVLRTGTFETYFHFQLSMNLKLKLVQVISMKGKYARHNLSLDLSSSS